MVADGLIYWTKEVIAAKVTQRLPQQRQPNGVSRPVVVDLLAVLEESFRATGERKPWKAQKARPNPGALRSW
jgi:hypothetical protein